MRMVQKGRVTALLGFDRFIVRNGGNVWEEAVEWDHFAGDEGGIEAVQRECRLG